jgi:ribose transport system permease protein
MHDSTRIEVARKDRRNRIADLARSYGREIGLPAVVIILMAIFGLTSEVFLTTQNLRNIGVAAAALAAVSFGQTFVVLTAGLDLSVGSTVALVSVVAAYGIRSHGIVLGVAEGVAAGTCVGIVNGLVITRLNVFPFIATLAMLSILLGIGAQSERRHPGERPAGSLRRFRVRSGLGLPAPFIVALIVSSSRT